MRRRRVVFAALVLLLTATLVVGTGADTVTYNDVDTLELQPAGEGTYVQEGENGEIRVVVDEDGTGVNDNAVTNLGVVFTVENLLEQGAESNVTLFIEKLNRDGVIEGGENSVTFYNADGGTDSRIDAEEGATLTPGSDVSIGMRIDTTRSDDPEAVIAFRLMAQVHDEDVFNAPSSFEFGSGSGSDSSDSWTDDESDEAEEQVSNDNDNNDDDGTTVTNPGPDPTANTDGAPPEPAAGGDGGDVDSEDDDTATGLIELASFGSPASLGAIGSVAATLSLIYAYRRRLATGTHARSAGGK